MFWPPCTIIQATWNKSWRGRWEEEALLTQFWQPISKSTCLFLHGLVKWAGDKGLCWWSTWDMPNPLQLCLFCMNLGWTTVISFPMSLFPVLSKEVSKENEMCNPSYHFHPCVLEQEEALRPWSPCASLGNWTIWPLRVPSNWNYSISYKWAGV